MFQMIQNIPKMLIKLKQLSEMQVVIPVDIFVVVLWSMKTTL